MTSPTQRTLKWLRDRGCRAQVVEHFNRFANVRVDLFGAIDIVAMIPDRIAVYSTTELSRITGWKAGIDPRRLMGIQACAGSSHAARLKKAQALPGITEWCETGAEFVVMSWSKKGGRGKRKLWAPRVTDLHGAELEPDEWMPAT